MAGEFHTDHRIINQINSLYSRASSNGILEGVERATGLPIRPLNLEVRDGKDFVVFDGSEELQHRYTEIFLEGGWVGNVVIPRVGEKLKFPLGLEIEFIRRILDCDGMDGAVNHAGLVYDDNFNLFIYGKDAVYNGPITDNPKRNLRTVRRSLLFAFSQVELG